MKIINESEFIKLITNAFGKGVWLASAERTNPDDILGNFYKFITKDSREIFVKVTKEGKVCIDCDASFSAETTTFYLNYNKKVGINGLLYEDEKDEAMAELIYRRACQKDLQRGIENITGIIKSLEEPAKYTNAFKASVVYKEYEDDECLADDKEIEVGGVYRVNFNRIGLSYISGYRPVVYMGESSINKNGKKCFLCIPMSREYTPIRVATIGQNSYIDCNKPVFLTREDFIKQEGRLYSVDYAKALIALNDNFQINLDTQGERQSLFGLDEDESQTLRLKARKSSGLVSNMRETDHSVEGSKQIPLLDNQTIAEIISERVGHPGKSDITNNNYRKDENNQVRMNILRFNDRDMIKIILNENDFEQDLYSTTEIEMTKFDVRVKVGRGKWHYDRPLAERMRVKMLERYEEYKYLLVEYFAMTFSAKYKDQGEYQNFPKQHRIQVKTDADTIRNRLHYIGLKYEGNWVLLVTKGIVDKSKILTLENIKHSDSEENDGE